FYGETRPSWTQGGDAFPGKDNSKDTVIGIDGKAYTSDQATIWRWRTAFQHDFAARMEWTVTDVSHANHNPEVVVNGQGGKAPLTLDARVGRAVALDAEGTHDRDGNRLKYSWVFYPEAGSGIPGQPVAAGPAVPIGGGGTQAEGGIPSAPAGGPREPAPRVTIDNASTARATVTPRVAGTAHIILVVEDDGSPSLTAYRRIILNIAP